VSNYTLSTDATGVTISRNGRHHTYSEEQLLALATDDAGDPVWGQALNLLRMVRGRGEVGGVATPPKPLQMGLFEEDKTA